MVSSCPLPSQPACASDYACAAWRLIKDLKIHFERLRIRMTPETSWETLKFLRILGPE